MINFKEEYELCNRLYSTDKETIELEGSNSIINNYHFKSDFSGEVNFDEVVSGNLYYHELTQEKFTENNDFIYPVILPKTGEKFKNGILFFHGLNERSWDKYFVWAKYLSEKTNRPVIMFPIAYHINRSPKGWSDPRMMTEVSNSRKQQVKSSSFVNAALSTRLEHNPEQFLISGIQSYYDVIKLTHQIKEGNHPLFEKDALLDIFSYSIGAFLSEVIILNNPDYLFSDSKLFMFCGGCTFDAMNGISKYIMDETAFESLQNFNDKKQLKKLFDILISKQLNNLKYTFNGLTLMMRNHNHYKKREKLLKKRGNRIFAVALQNDKVIPAQNIVATLKGRKGVLPVKVEIIDFPYPYSHEMPFPLNDPKIYSLVDRSFTAVFDKATDFFIGSRYGSTLVGC